MSGTAAIIFILMFLLSLGTCAVFKESSFIVSFASADCGQQTNLGSFIQNRFIEAVSFSLGFAGIILGVFKFRDAFSVFALFTVWLMVFGGIPISLFSSSYIDSSVKFAIGGIFTTLSILYLFAVMSFFRGGTEL